MEAKDFPEANHTFHKPADMTDKECGSLRVFDTGDAFISCWQPSDIERELIAKGGDVYLWVWGRGHPPVSVTATRPWR